MGGESQARTVLRDGVLMPTIEQLNQRHPSYDSEEHCDLEALYRGDKHCERRAGKFIPQWDLETGERYTLRKRLFHYRNYLGAVIDYFTALLFTGKAVAVATDESGKQVDAPDEYYADFRDDCDGAGTDLEVFFKSRLTDAMVHGCSWFGIEHASDEGQPAADRAEFEERKLGNCELFELDHCDVYDWECDDDGRLAWVLVHSVEAKRAGLSGGRNQIVERWAHYLPDRVDVYRIGYDKSQPPTPSTEVPLDPVESHAHRFGSVPILCMELPVALWAANRLKTPQLAHMRASNAQTWSLANSCYSMMLFRVEDPETFSKATLGAGRGLILGKEEEAEWLVPGSEHFSALDIEIKAQKDEIFRLAHQMALGVENNAAAIGRSAQSKASDSESTRVILQAYGDVVMETMERVYDMMSAVRGDEFTWSIEGLGSFTQADIGGLLESLAQIDKVGGIPSPTWQHRIKSQLAETTLPDLDEATKKTISEEIKAALDKQQADAEATTAAEAAILEQVRGHMNGNPRGAGGGAKPPAVGGRNGGGPGAAPPQA